MKKFLGSPTEVETENYKQELETLKDENNKLQKRIKELESLVIPSILNYLSGNKLIFFQLQYYISQDA